MGVGIDDHGESPFTRDVPLSEGSCTGSDYAGGGWKGEAAGGVLVGEDVHINIYVQLIQKG
ncbi:MAG: hypothetical protein A3I72_11130 [Candidatus Tectomicrobia bacterium RIFCSPLOWO2_02_FULL_70_19]|nr:MAG: hypothetical protein A3I72_11130 [Candidatus Tectomicrobia bacterium RIFCSPLOWO2_02_FULL_70_19]